MILGQVLMAFEEIVTWDDNDCQVLKSMLMAWRVIDMGELQLVQVNEQGGGCRKVKLVVYYMVHVWCDICVLMFITHPIWSLISGNNLYIYACDKLGYDLIQGDGTCAS